MFMVAGKSEYSTSSDHTPIKNKTYNNDIFFLLQTIIQSKFIL